MVFGQPGGDAALSGNRRDRDRPDRGGPAEGGGGDDQPGEQTVHDMCSGSRMPVAELRSISTARAASMICAGVTLPMRSGQPETSSRFWPIASAVPMMLAGPDWLSRA